jgi:hypothetical protein
VRSATSDAPGSTVAAGGTAEASGRKISRRWNTQSNPTSSSTTPTTIASRRSHQGTDRTLTLRPVRTAGR